MNYSRCLTLAQRAECGLLDQEESLDFWLIWYVSHPNDNKAGMRFCIFLRDAAEAGLIEKQVTGKSLRLLLESTPRAIVDILIPNDSPLWKWLYPEVHAETGKTSTGGSVAEKARNNLTRPEVLPHGSVDPALPAPSGRTRVVGIRKAIEAADAVLIARLHRAPEAQEVFDYLAEHDETGTVVDHKHGVLIWVDSNGKLHDQTFKAMRNLLSDIRRVR